MSRKICFVICPLKGEDSKARKRSDKILNLLIRPIAGKLGYETLTANKVGKPGPISAQIFEHLFKDDLVIADLTETNPNVLYELAIRHTAMKPAIHLAERGQKLPFHLGGYRTIFITSGIPDRLSKARAELEKQIKAVEEDPKVLNPLSQVEDFVRPGVVSEITKTEDAMYDLGKRIAESSKGTLMMVQRTPSLLLGPGPTPYGQSRPHRYDANLITTLEDWIEGITKNPKEKKFLYLYSPGMTKKEMRSGAKLGGEVEKRLRSYKAIEDESKGSFRIESIKGEFSGPMALGDDVLAFWVAKDEPPSKRMLSVSVRWPGLGRNIYGAFAEMLAPGVSTADELLKELGLL